ncbi:MAG: CHAD domain-containing protein, partial [Candidatus Eisenbacteria bacterium]|nr:CHAD domain-containing protein [Candidatus Latescibacterota bacterium]MBD3303071.1 CHAD domain-containing protein [Candidatus Eisenbacteria bacterium]
MQENPSPNALRSAPPVDQEEIEWQLSGAPLEGIEAWLTRSSAPSPYRIDVEPTVEIVDRYLDTEDWRLHRAGLVLRIRTRGAESEATLKGFSSRENGLVRRREITEPLPHGEREALLRSTGPVGRRIESLCGKRSLRALFAVRTNRRVFRLATNGSRIGTIALDRFVVAVPGRNPAPEETRVEVEAAGSDEPLGPVQAFLDQLRRALPLAPVEESKFEVGLRLSGLVPPAPLRFGETRIDRGMTIEEVAFAVLRRQFTKMVAHEPGTRLGEDPEELHDMRVATRRLRAALRLFGDALPSPVLRWTIGLKRTASALGEVRDLDVQLEDLEAWESVDGRPDEGALAPLTAELRARRDRARRRMLARL